MNSKTGRRAPTARSHQVDGDRWGAVLSGGGLGLLLAVIPIALCDYSGHGLFVADKRLELLILGMLVGACGGALRLGWQAKGRVDRSAPVSTCSPERGGMPDPSIVVAPASSSSLVVLDWRGHRDHVGVGEQVADEP